MESQEHVASTAPRTATKLLDRVRDAIRTRHYSRRTEEAYVHWIRRYIVFHRKTHPAQMGAPEISQFLTWLAVDRQVSASTQNQALAGLLFLYSVLNVEIGSVPPVVRARTPDRLPVVLSREEVGALLKQLTGTERLIVMVLCGSGVRLEECLELRVKDLDFDRHQIVVRQGKGQKDRVTMLPSATTQTLLGHLAEVRRLHETDLARGFGRVVQHLHVHCLVTGGALARDRTRWIRGRAAFLFPVQALAIVFRAKYLAGLQRAFNDGELTFAASTAPFADAGQFAALVAQLRATSWVVYAKRPFGGPTQVLQYLGRYTHRIAISNARLISLIDGVVQFRWKDYADRGVVEVLRDHHSDVR